MKNACAAILVGCVAIVVGIIIMIIVSIQTLQSDQMAVMYNTVLRDLYTQVRQEGLHNGPPGFRFIIFPAVYRTISYPSLQCLNKDGVIITLDIAFQYQVSSITLRDTVLQFKNHEHFRNILEYAGESAIHEACSKYNTTEFQSSRQEFQTSVRELLSSRYQTLNTTIDDLQVNNIARPTEYENAVRSKEAARENIQVAVSEKPRKLTEALTTEKEAQTAATIATNKANSDSRIALTRAEAEAEGIYNEYETEVGTYMQIIQEQNLTIEGFLAYMGVRTVGLAHNPVYAGINAPAKTSYLGP